MPQYDASRWAIAKDGSRRRFVRNAANYGADATEGALELAAAYGVNLAVVQGTGSDGRITKADVEAYLEDDE